MAGVWVVYDFGNKDIPSPTVTLTSIYQKILFLVLKEMADLGEPRKLGVLMNGPDDWKTVEPCSY